MGSKVRIWLQYIAGNAKKLRIKAGLTQEQLGEKAGIDPRYVQDVERARSNISMAVFIGLAEALGVAPSRLLRPADLPHARPGRPRSRKTPLRRAKGQSTPR
jgi:transcriptional regulator with XRE-family HTH domain